MSSPKYTPFQRHFLWYAEPHPPHRITILSSTRGSLRLGFNFPYSLILSIMLRVLYSPDRLPIFPFTVSSIPASRTRSQLEQASLKESSYSLAEIFGLYAAQPFAANRGVFDRLLDKLHIWGWWAAAANVKTDRVDREDIEKFQSGSWQEEVAERRVSRAPGKGGVIPFARAGPISVAGHSWAVKRSFGVDVYRP